MKSCKNCKTKFTPQYSTTQVACSPKCAIELSKNVSEKESKIKQRQEAKAWKEKKRAELKTIPNLLEDAQKVFNEYIRLRDKDMACISCGGTLGLKYDAGHRWSVKNYSGLRYNEENVYAQCVSCNQHRDGNEGEYRLGLEAKIGKERVEYIDSIRHTKVKWDRSYLEELISTYKNKIKELKNN